jgi:hypothetical protein
MTANYRLNGRRPIRRGLVCAHPTEVPRHADDAGTATRRPRRSSAARWAARSSASRRAHHAGRPGVAHAGRDRGRTGEARRASAPGRLDPGGWGTDADANANANADPRRTRAYAREDTGMMSRKRRSCARFGARPSPSLASLPFRTTKRTDRPSTTGSTCHSFLAPFRSIRRGVRADAPVSRCGGSRDSRVGSPMSGLPQRAKP